MSTLGTVQTWLPWFQGMRLAPCATRKPALFLDERAAKAAAMLHSPDGWGVEYIKPTDRQFEWLVPQAQAATQPRPVASIGPPSDLTDDVTWGADLSERVKPGIKGGKECEELPQRVATADAHLGPSSAGSVCN